jgi:hypothetical protein
VADSERPQYNRYAPKVFVNGRHLETIDARWTGGALGPDDRGVLELVIGQPEPKDLLTVSTQVQIQIGDAEPKPFRVTSAITASRTYSGLDDGTSAEFHITLSEVVPSPRAATERDDSIEVLYRSAFMTAATRNLVRALEELLDAKGIITAEELRQQLAKTTRESFINFALDIVAEEEAFAMEEALLDQLEEGGREPGDLQAVP